MSVFEPRGKFEASISLISGTARLLKAIKMSILVKVEFLDFTNSSEDKMNQRNVIEVQEMSVLSCVKMRPF